MPMRSVEVEAVAQADQIPADVIAFVHSHHRHVAEQIAVDGGANVRRNEPATDNREISVGIAGAAVQLLNVFGSVVWASMLWSRYQLLFSSMMKNEVTNSRSTSLGVPSGRAMPFLVMMIEPISPAFVS